jgi:hypothetical protein
MHQRPLPRKKHTPGSTLLVSAIRIVRADPATRMALALRFKDEVI